MYAVAEDVARHGRAAFGRWQPRVDAEFGGTEGFLLDVRRRWLTAVAAYSDHVAGPAAEAARYNAPLRALLDAFAEHPVVNGLPGARAVHAEPA
ncbi:MAG: hypothetical protein ACRDQB_13815 [Thermocrispum sp.]